MFNTKKSLAIISIALLSSNISYWFEMDMWDDFMDTTSFDSNYDFDTDITSDYTDTGNSLTWISWDYETTQEWVIVVKEWGSINLGINAEAKKIILNNAKKIQLGVNANVTTIEWTVEEAVFWVNSVVEELFLKVDTLKVSVNSELKSWNIYVYKNFEWWVNAGFKWKMTVYGETSMGVNTDVNGRYCSLGKVGLGVNANIETYSMDGLLGNVDPILDVTQIDGSQDFKDVEKITTDFDVKFETSMKKIDALNWEIASLKSKIAKTTDETEKSTLSTNLTAKVAEKTTLKEETTKLVNTTFLSLEPYIDSDERNLELFGKIKNIYLFAVTYEDIGGVYNICNNSEVSGSVNSVYQKGGKIYFWNKSFARKIVLPQSEITSLDKMMDKIPDEKLAKINSKIDTMVEWIADKKKTSKADEKNINLLMDVKELLQAEMLYE